eukprot:1442237-Rhodomonas_salina.1
MLNDPAYADVWASALRQSDLGDLEERMVWEKEFLLSLLHKNWNDNKALGITAPQLKKQQEQWLAQIVRSLNRQGINALVQMFIVKGDD